jgi:hypothetical protein
LPATIANINQKKSSMKKKQIFFYTMKKSKSPRFYQKQIMALLVAVTSLNSLWAQTSKPIAVPNSTITTCVSDGNNTYIGGAFTKIYTPAKYVTRIDKTTGKVDTSFFTFDGQISAMVSDGNGGWYIGGSFSTISNVSRKYLAHILSGGSLDTSWTPVSSGDIYTMVMGDSSCLYVGGNFSTINGVSHQGIAKIKSDGSLSNWNITLAKYASVNSIAIGDSSSIYIGGYFSTVNGLTRSNLAKIRYNGEVASWNPGASSTVSTLMIGDSSHIYIGGLFSTVGGLTRKYIAKIKPDGTVAAWNPNANGIVYSIVKTDSSCVEIGGSFTTIGGITRYHIAKVKADGSLSDWNIQFTTGTSMYVRAMEYSNGKLYVGGYFDGIGHASRNNIACIGDTAYSETWNPDFSGLVSFLKITDNYVYASGSFYGVNPISRTYLSKIKRDGTVDTSWNVAIAYAPRSLAIDSSGNVYVGGAFTSIGGKSISYLAKVSAKGLVDESWAPNPNSSVNTLTMGDSSYLYIGGYFTSIGGVSRTYLCKVKTTDASISSWHPVISSGYPPVKMTIDRKKYLYISMAGTTTIDGLSRTGLARFLPNGALDNNWVANVTNNGSPDIKGLAVDRYQNLYICGNYTAINSTDATWFTSISSSCVVSSISVNNYMYALNADSAGYVYIGGALGNIAGCSYYLGRIKPNATFDCSWGAGISSTVNTLASDSKGNVYVGTESSPYLLNIYTPYITGSTEIDSVTLTYTDADGNIKTTLSDSTAYYFISTEDGLSTKVTPSKTGYDFTPTSRTYSNLNGVKTKQDFKASVAITLSPDSLSFDSVAINSSSEVLSFSVYCLKTDSNLIVSPPRCFEVSLSSTSGFQSTPLSIVPSNGQIHSTMIYVRFSPTSARKSNNKITLTAYGLSTKTIAVTGIGKGTLPVLSWDTPSGITYGTLLSSVQLNATANVAGIFTYFPSAGSKLDAVDGYQFLTVVFSPTDSLYNEVSGGVVIAVSKAPLTVTANDISMNYGGTIPDLTVSYAGFVTGDGESVIDETPAVETSATNSSAIGTYPITVSGGSDNNYSFTYVNGTLTILDATGISSNTMVNGVSVYPNPVAKELTLNNPYLEKGDYIVISLTGNILQHGNITGNSTQINMQALPAGLYLLKIAVGNSTYQFKIVKK